MTAQTLEIRRRTNGTIDIDHYRNRALMERSAAMTSTGRQVNFSFLAAAAAALIVTAFALPSHDPASKTATKAAPAAITVALVTH
jgi:hypothetical protein